MSASYRRIRAASPTPRHQYEIPNSDLRAFSDATRAFAEATPDYEGLLRTVAERMTRLFADGCLVSLVSDDRTSFRPASGFCRDDTGTARARAAFVGAPVQDALAGLSAKVVRMCRAQVFPRLDPGRLGGTEYGDAVMALGVHSLFVLVLRARGHTLGALTLVRYSADAPPFDGEDAALARTLADHAALAISNATLLDRVTRDSREQRAGAEQDLPAAGDREPRASDRPGATTSAP